MKKFRLLFTTTFTCLVLPDSYVFQWGQAQTPRPKPPIKKISPPFASPTPACSPMPTPLSEAAKNDPDRRENPLETMDSDCDGVCDITDNCLLVHNPHQLDANGDGIGDACDPKLVDKSVVDSRCDMDGDGVPDNKDSCPWVCNPRQEFTDINKNGVNDLCDNSLPNSEKGQKFCTKRIKVKPPNLTDVSASPASTIIPPATASATPACSPMPTPLSEEDRNNPIRELTVEEQLNAGLGTYDWDCDGVCNNADNCIFVYNPNQKDSDNDGKGDLCNPLLVDRLFKDSRCDEDGDGVPDDKDNCPRVCNPRQEFTDINKNGVNDLCDNSLPNAMLGWKLCVKRIKVKPPNLPDVSASPASPIIPTATASPTASCSPLPKAGSESGIPNPEMTLENFVNAGLGTLDFDCDGICNYGDNCMLVYNPQQKDSDADGNGDACDPKNVDPSFMDSRCDDDRDGIPDIRDNCVVVCNPSQKDINKNGIGDVCDRAFPNPFCPQGVPGSEKS